MTIFFTADTHFNHANIIRYSKRPFPDVETMNRVLSENWIESVTPEDTMVFVGDFAMGRYEHLLRKVMVCKTIFVKGNHDKKLVVPCHFLNRETRITSENGTQFLVIHDPDEISPDYHGWVIHGHHHNNYPDTYPFFNPDRKTINVGVDMTGFRPVSLDEIMSKISRGVKFIHRDESP